MCMKMLWPPFSVGWGAAAISVLQYRANRKNHDFPNSFPQPLLSVTVIGGRIDLPLKN